MERVTIRKTARKCPFKSTGAHLSCYACSIFTVNRTSENRNEWCSGDQKAWENVIKCLPGLLCNFMYQVAFYICRLYMYIHIYTHTICRSVNFKYFLIISNIFHITSGKTEYFLPFKINVCIKENQSCQQS